MPIGGRPPQDDRNKLYTIRIPRREPLFQVIPPKRRPGSDQKTVIRYDRLGQYFVDLYVEGMKIVEASDEERQGTRILNCPKYHFTVDMLVCPHYCARPCEDHLAELQKHGWFRFGGQPIHKGSR